MKKLFLTTALLIGSLYASQAQITIEQSDFPTPGDALVQGRDTLVSTSITVGLAGANQTYDFNELKVWTIDTLDFAEPNTVTNGDSFPSAFLALSQFGGYGFAEQNGNDVEIIGFSGSFMGFGQDLVVKFDDPQKIISIPANYQDSFTDTSLIDVKISNNPPIFQLPIPIQIDSIRFKRVAVTESEIDGWGTYVGHTGSYDCLRQKNHEMSVDSVWVYAPLLGGWTLAPNYPPFTNPNVTDQYRYNYITKEIGYFIASVVTDTTDSIMSATFETVPDSCCVDPNGISEYGPAENITVYPNPAVDEVTIVTASADLLNFELFDLTGKLVVNQTISGTKRLNVESLDRGIYLYRVSTKEGELLRTGKLSFTR